MTPQTELVLKQIVAQDDSIDPDRIGRAFALLRTNSRYTTEPEYILHMDDVMKLLGIARCTLYKYFKQGLLKRIYGEGDQALGVSQSSYIAFTNRRPERSAAA